MGGNKTDKQRQATNINVCEIPVYYRLMPLSKSKYRLLINIKICIIYPHFTVINAAFEVTV